VTNGPTNQTERTFVMYHHKDSSAVNTASIAHSNGASGISQRASPREPSLVQTQLPWFQFYVGDVHRRIEDMNATEVGAYLLLLMFYWNHDCLPAENDLQFVARVTGKPWRAMKDKVISRVRQDIPALDEQKAKGRARSRKAKGAAKGRWDENAYANA
jgi:hypothetical protein